MTRPGTYTQHEPEIYRLLETGLGVNDIRKKLKIPHAAVYHYAEKYRRRGEKRWCPRCRVETTDIHCKTCGYVTWLDKKEKSLCGRKTKPDTEQETYNPASPEQLKAHFAELEARFL